MNAGFDWSAPFRGAASHRSARVFPRMGKAAHMISISYRGSRDKMRVNIRRTAARTMTAGAVSGETLNLVKFCTYELTAPLAPISVNLTIQGDEDTVERSYRRGTPGFSVFVVTDGANVVFNQLNIRNGNSSGTGNQSPVDNSGYGGAIYNEDGNITVTGGTMRGNTANLDGGAIDNLGGMTVQGTVFQGNQADNGGAIATGFQELGSLDAFIHAAEVNRTTVTGSSFSGNSAINGGAMYIEDSTAVLHCDFTGNTADAGGGGIDIVGGV